MHRTTISRTFYVFFACVFIGLFITSLVFPIVSLSRDGYRVVVFTVVARFDEVLRETAWLPCLGESTSGGRNGSPGTDGWISSPAASSGTREPVAADAEVMRRISQPAAAVGSGMVLVPGFTAGAQSVYAMGLASGVVDNPHGGTNAPQDLRLSSSSGAELCLFTRVIGKIPKEETIFRLPPSALRNQMIALFALSITTMLFSLILVAVTVFDITHAGEWKHNNAFLRAALLATVVLVAVTLVVAIVLVTRRELFRDFQQGFFADNVEVKTQVRSGFVVLAVAGAVAGAAVLGLPWYSSR